MPKQELKKPLRQLGKTPDYEGPAKAQQPGRLTMESLPGSGRQGHPNKQSQTTGDMKFLE